MKQPKEPMRSKRQRPKKGPEQANEEYTQGALAILEAAERLIGQHGINGVSIRQITLAAGMANNSAVAYHFGDRDALLRAISQWRLPILTSKTEELYQQAEREGRLDDPTMLLRVILEPTFHIVDADGKNPHAPFMREMMRSAEGVAIRLSMYSQTDPVRMATRRFFETAPDVPIDLLKYRLRLTSLAIFDAITARDLGLHGPGFTHLDDDEFLAELLAMGEAMVLRPVATVRSMG